MKVIILNKKEWQKPETGFSCGDNLYLMNGSGYADGFGGMMGNASGGGLSDLGNCYKGFGCGIAWGHGQGDGTGERE
jgi:hypothetical protein